MCNLAEFGFRRANSYGYNSFCGEGGEYYVSSFSSAFIPILPFLWPLWRPPPLSPPLFSFFTSAFPKLNIIDTHTHTHTLSVSLPRSFLLSYFLPPQSLIYLPRTEQSTAVYWILVISHRKNRQKRSRWSNFRGVCTKIHELFCLFILFVFSSIIFILIIEVFGWRQIDSIPGLLLSWKKFDMLLVI